MTGAVTLQDEEKEEEGEEEEKEGKGGGGETRHSQTLEQSPKV